MRIEKSFNDLTAMELYFLYLNDEKFIEALQSFSKGVGYCVDELTTAGFSHEYNVGEDGYFGDTSIKFEIEPPACEDHLYQIVPYNSSLSMLIDMSRQYINAYPEQSESIYNLLELIKHRMMEN